MLNRKLVIVDDSPSVLEALKTRLETEGFSVATADDGDRAIAVILRERPDLIISDIQMPNLDGYLLCQIIRSRPETRDIPFIFLTKLDAPAKRVHGLKLGADDFVAKPFVMDELVLRVKNILKRAGREIDPIRRKDDPRTLSGTLADFTLPDILQMLGLSHRSATILLARQGEEGRIVVKEGRVVGAGLGVTQGPKAFFRLFRWKDGDFRLDYFDPKAFEENMNDEIEHAMMEALVNLDEENALIEKLGGLDAVLTPTGGKLPAGTHLGKDGPAILELAQKLGSLSHVLEASSLPDIETLKEVDRLVKMGALRPSPSSAASS